MKHFISGALVVAALVSLGHAQYPESYCTAGVTSNLCAAQIGANTQPDVANTAGCLISVSVLPGNRQGLVFYGVDNSGFTPSLWGGPAGVSYLCVKAPTTRIGGAQNSGGTSGQCNGTFVVDWDAFQLASPSALGSPWAVGEKAFVQAWYRDPLALLGSNLSNALELTLRNPWPVPCAPLPGMVAISPGTFLMGSQALFGFPYYGNTNEQPPHLVNISYCFWMAETEVTQSQFSALMGANPSFFVAPNGPVERVTWHQARAYCAALTLQQLALGNVPPGYEYRLPTEAEWEYACRAGTTTEYYVGASLLCSQANFSYSNHSVSSCNSSGPVSVGSYAPNAWGLYDMHGNVNEWCLDSLDSYSAATVTDPFVTGGSTRAARGGSWEFDSAPCRSARRGGNYPNVAVGRVGFRVVLAPILVP